MPSKPVESVTIENSWPEVSTPLVGQEREMEATELKLNLFSDNQENDEILSAGEPVDLYNFGYDYYAAQDPDDDDEQIDN